jgi:hypothetical protein
MTSNVLRGECNSSHANVGNSGSSQTGASKRLAKILSEKVKPTFVSDEMM